jgi:hypothetical protein
MKKWILFLSLPLFLSCTGGGKVSDGSSGQKIQIFYNNDNNGYLEPCGCRLSPIGGMDRRWNGMKAFPDEGRIFVDAGNLLFKSTSASEYFVPQWFEQARGVIEAYNLLGATAVAPGSTDFALGLAEFKHLAKEARFPFLSANLYERSTGKRLLQDRIIVERKGKKIGIFGIFHPRLPLPAELEARDPVAAAREAVRQLKAEGADFILALAHQGLEFDQALANAVPAINMIVGAHSQSFLQIPEEVGDTLIVQLSNQGQLLGMVEYDATSLPKNRTQFVVADLDDNYKQGPSGLANPMPALLAVTNIRMQEANRKLDEKIWKAHQGKAPGFQTFLSCRDCHGPQAEFQEKRRHAAAFLTLMARDKERNLDCVKCHSVGMGKEGGFRTMNEAFVDSAGAPVKLEAMKKALGPDFPPKGTDYRKSPELIQPHVARWIASMKKADIKKSFVSVQCENCHGPRPDHPFGGNSSSGKVYANACLSCHTKEQMPAWYDGAGKLNQTAVDKAIATVACPMK